MTATEFVFTYGANMDLGQMGERCPNSKDLFQPFVARADGWRLWFPRSSERRQGGVGSMMSAPEPLGFAGAASFGLPFTGSEPSSVRQSSTRSRIVSSFFFNWWDMAITD